MKCPNCGTPAPTGDRFCEECGTPLTVPNTVSTGNCEKCGAPSQEIDAEGYCCRCGFRNETKASDRLEIAIAPELGAVSDRGLRHARNEDYFSLQKIEAKNTYILVACDGVSSSREPEKAAKAAAEEACAALTAAVEKNIELEAAMKQAIAKAQVSVCAISDINSQDDPPSTTLIAAIVQNRTATIGWLGDSRAYWIASEGSRQLTRDDSWLYDMVASGQMTEAEARKSGNAHAITRWIGADSDDSSNPSIVHFNIPGAGYLLLCTDGLWNYAPDAAQMAALVNKFSGASSVTISRNLVEFALRSGGYDNITVAVLSL